jgi:hypothetical protein
MTEQETFEGLAADNKVRILGARFSTAQEFELGEKVTLLVYGYVTMTGREVFKGEGERGLVEIKAGSIEVRGGNL